MQWFALQFMCLTSFFDFLRSLRDFWRFKQEKFDTADASRYNKGKQPFLRGRSSAGCISYYASEVQDG